MPGLKLRGKPVEFIPVAEQGAPGAGSVPHTLPTRTRGVFRLLPLQERGLSRAGTDERTLGNQPWTPCGSFSPRVGARFRWGSSRGAG